MPRARIAHSIGSVSRERHRARAGRSGASRRVRIGVGEYHVAGLSPDGKPPVVLTRRNASPIVCACRSKFRAAPGIGRFFCPEASMWVDGPLAMRGLRPGGRGWLVALCASRVGAYMVYIAYAATLPVLQREWYLSGTAAGSIASAFQIAYAISLMGCSALADRVGARRIFLAGTLASAVVSVAFAALARDYWTGLGLYTLLALSLGGTYTTGILLVAENIPVVRRGRAMGQYLAGHSLGLALGLVLTGAAIPRGGYVVAFWLVASGPLVGGLFAWLAMDSTEN